MVNYNTVSAPQHINNTNRTSDVVKKQTDIVQMGINATGKDLPLPQIEASLSMATALVPGNQELTQFLSAHEAEFGQILNAYKEAAKKFNGGADPVYVGDLAKFMAMAMISSLADQRKNALNDRLAARETAKAEQLQQADKMEEAADKMTIGANATIAISSVSGAIAVTGSLTSAFGTISQLKTMAKSTKATNEGSERLAELAKQTTQFASQPHAMKSIESAQSAASSAQAAAQKAFETASAKSQAFTGVGQATNSGGDIGRNIASNVDTRTQAEAKELDAEGARDSAEAQFSQQMTDLKKEVQDALSDMIKQVINFLKEIRDAEVDAMRALTKV